MKNQLFFEKMLVEDAKIDILAKNINKKEEKFRGFVKSEIEVNNQLSKKLNRRVGKYFTFNFTNYNITLLQKEIAKTISLLLGNNTENLLIVGLGNRFVASDSLGENTIASIKSDVKKFCPSVKSLTNIESTVVVKGIVQSIKPDAIIVIDSLATLDITKLACSIQITDAGIIAGGGVGSSSKLYSTKTMGVKVIAVGVPLIVNLASKVGVNAFLCPHQIDIYVNKVSKILSKSIDLLVLNKF